MVFEHFALNVKNPVEISDWYCDHLGLNKAFAMETQPFTTFLTDSENRVVCEFYHRPEATIYDLKKEHPLTFHIAFESEDAAGDRERLIRAGCILEEEVNPKDGGLLVMLRDPFGIPLQICQRAKKLNK